MIPGRGVGGLGLGLAFACFFLLVGVGVGRAQNRALLHDQIEGGLGVPFPHDMMILYKGRSSSSSRFVFYR